MDSVTLLSPESFINYAHLRSNLYSVQKSGTQQLELQKISRFWFQNGALHVHPKKHPRSPGITETPCLQQTFLVGRITASHRPSWGAALGPLGRSTQIHLLNHWRCTTGYPSEWRKLQKKSTKCWLQVRTQEPWGSILNVLPLWQPVRKNVFKPCVFHE